MYYTDGVYLQGKLIHNIPDTEETAFEFSNIGVYMYTASVWIEMNIEVQPLEININVVEFSPRAAFGVGKALEPSLRSVNNPNFR